MSGAKNRNPVLLVHGIFRQAGVFNRMSAYLSKLGWSVYALNMTLSDAELGIDHLAEEVAAYIDKTFGAEQPIDLVGLSMGGLVSRYYLQRLGGIERVQRFVTISSPHNGTSMAYLLPQPTCIQMRPGSAFIDALNEDAAILERVNFTSIWTPWDFIILPAHSSRMAVGKEVKVQVFAHAGMVMSVKSLQAVAEALNEPVKPHHRLVRTPEPQKLPQNGNNI
ncbi:MAG: triacylglycerol lipase [Microcoleus vaginatus WJT46-NPBG5]|jgi:triacylglycerol lipase|nr:triacylglycerol lipase [Microcoleus vaginatus WJT46-NPBG5]